MVHSKKEARAECIRCGTCCSKGGPAIHKEDLIHIDGGSVPLSALYTIRKGELAYDNVSPNGGLICMPSEIVKVKSRTDSSACMYFNEAEKSCEIYNNRPAECRGMECWNTAFIECMYSQGRLDRTGILRNVSWLLELVAAHESRCSLDKVKEMVALRESGDRKGTEELNEMINYDAHLRNLVVEKGNLPETTLDFLFGRPLVQIISGQFGVKIIRTGTGYSEL